jgi:hypothetical protein
LDNAIDHFIDKSYEHVISISHNDADGFSCSAIIQNLLYKMQIPVEYHIFNLATSWKQYLKNFFPKLGKKKNAFVLTDIGSNVSELSQIAEKRKEDFYILDHHEINQNIDDLEPPENLFLLNPTIYGFDGLDDIAGATLTYMFSKQIKPSITKLGWLAILGIAGDSLKSMDKLKSFNLEVYEEILNEEIIEENDGVILFGGMHEKIKEGLRSSILPFIKELEGELQKSKILLRKLKINENTPVVSLIPEEVKKLQGATKEDIVGKSAILPMKNGLLRYAFEHAILLNILGFNNINMAFNMVLSPNITLYAKKMYYDYIKNLVKNLNTITKIQKQVSERSIIIDAGGKISPSNWSDLASFATVNEILDPEKILFLGGEEQRYHMIKLSVRCTKKYIENHPGKGANYIIENIKRELGGIGGGHKLAGGIKISQNSFNILRENIDNYID